ncbi:MAG TPA: hypothetical protein VFV33_07950, partial [Gemmatimonadaceae bacterium]|nr:hypothetical protein [Gemmatimonadaceae bacterium]
MRSLRPALLAATAGIIASVTLACGTDPSSGRSPLAPATSAGLATSSATPTFLSPDPTAPAIANPVITFWARRNVDTSVFMYYRPRPGRADSTVFLRFRVRKRSLAYFPNGTPFGPSDSVQITITFTDASTRTV